MFKFTQYVLFPIWFSFFSPITLENIFQPHLFKRHPSRFMSIRHFLYPKRSLPFSSISLKNYIPPHVYFNAPVMFYIYPSFFVSDSIFTLFVDELTKLYMNPHLSQSARHILYLPITFFSRCNFSSYRRLGKQKYVLTHVDLKKPVMFYIYTSCLISDTIFILLAD